MMLISIILACCLAAVATGAAAQYGMFSPWTTHRTGIGLFITLAAFATAAILTPLRLVWAYPIWVAWIGYGFAIGALVFIWVVIAMEQIRGRRARRRKRQQVNHPPNP